MKEVRCKKCKGTLARAEMMIGSIRCHRCKTINEITLVSQKILTIGLPTANLKVKA